MVRPDDGQTPRNVAGVEFYDVTSVSVNEWHPLPKGRGDPECVSWCKADRDLQDRQGRSRY